MAFGTGTINNIGGAVSDIFGGQATANGLRLRAAGSMAEAENYDLASTLAKQNSDFTEISTGIKVAQSERQAYLGIGTTAADIAGAGFSMGGSALDIMRSGAQQAALTREVIGQQGLITEAGFDEQELAYRNMAASARATESAQSGMAGDAERNGWITGGIKGAAALASLFI